MPDTITPTFHSHVANMSMWEYFAGQALMGIEGRDITINPADSADRAARVADAMMDEIKRRINSQPQTGN